MGKFRAAYAWNTRFHLIDNWERRNPTSQEVAEMNVKIPFYSLRKITG